MSALNVTPRVNRAAPCGASLATGRRRRLSGAALQAKLERQLREELVPWGLPLNTYDCTIVSARTVISGMLYAIGGDVLTATFTHRETRAEVVVTGIWVDDNGTIVQLGNNYGALAL